MTIILIDARCEKSIHSIFPRSKMSNELIPIPPSWASNFIQEHGNFFSWLWRYLFALPRPLSQNLWRNQKPFSFPSSAWWNTFMSNTVALLRNVKCGRRIVRSVQNATVRVYSNWTICSPIHPHCNDLYEQCYGPYNLYGSQTFHHAGR